jgi:hypothetical protein
MPPLVQPLSQSMPALPTTPSTLFEVVCAAQQSMMALVNVCHSMASQRPDYGLGAVAATQTPAQRAAQSVLRPSTPPQLHHAPPQQSAAYATMPQHAAHHQPRGGRGHKPFKPERWTENGQYH